MKRAWRSGLFAALASSASPIVGQTVSSVSSVPLRRAAAPSAGRAPVIAPVSSASLYEVRNGFSLAFVDADVRRVVDAVLGAMLHVDYSVDPKVSGTVTLRTARPVTAEALVPLLETALRSVDAAILPAGSGYRVVPRSEARARAPIATGGSDDVLGFRAEVVTLRFAGAREMVRLLEQFLGKDIVAGSEPAYNQIILSGSADERRAARTLIARFDVDALAGVAYNFIHLDNVDPDTMAVELERIFKPPLDVIGTRVKIVPLPRMHALLALAADRNDLNRIEPWIRRLDAGGSGKRKLYSYAVQNGRARDLAQALQLVLGVQVTASTSPSSPSSFGAPSGLGGSVFGGSVSSLGQSLSSSAGVSAAAPKEPSDPIGALTPLPGSSTPILSPGGEGPRIVPNDDTNALLIWANGEEYELIRSALDKVDLPVPQILIEATLAEVTLTKDFSAGVDWSVLSGRNSFRLNNTGNAVPTAIFPGFSYAYLGVTAQAVLNTLQSRTNVRVLSAPKLMVLNNQTATLQVGDQVPIVTQQSQSVSAAGAPIVNSVELHDTGVILKVTPRVNDSGNVQLDIAQEVSDVRPTTTSGINSPTIQQRRLATTVAGRSGQLIALGGLIRTNSAQVRSGFPLLSQIPILGAAFGRQTIMGERTELIILLTPTVIRAPVEVDATVNELIDRMDGVRLMMEQAKKPGFPVPPRR